MHMTPDQFLASHREFTGAAGRWGLPEDSMKARQEHKPVEMKISETFLRFAAPILDEMPEGTTPSEIERLLLVPCTIWNAVVFDHASGTEEQVTRVRETAAQDPVSAAIVEHLIERKRVHFVDDMRLIGKYRVKRYGPAEISLWAEARDPYSAIRNSRPGDTQPSPFRGGPPDPR